jgi:Tol biopolymer transport system component
MGAEGDGSAGGAALSADGRYVAFNSGASNLVLGDTNGASDIFVHDRLTGLTELVSVSAGGVQANRSSFEMSISADGRFVAFDSDATNLVPGDTNSAGDIFVRDRLTGITTRASVSSLGGQTNSFGTSSEPSISADGNLVAFTSFANNLVPGDTNFRPDVFVHDTSTGTTERVSVSSTGDQGDGSSFAPSLSADGNSIAFTSLAQNFTAGDTNADADVFVHDRTSGTTDRVSLSTTGAEGNGRSDLPSISADGMRVAYVSGANTLVDGDTNGADDVFLTDRTTGETQRVSVRSRSRSGRPREANGPSFDPAISADGTVIAFSSLASNLVPDDTNEWGDVYVHDLAATHEPPGN